MWRAFVETARHATIRYVCASAKACPHTFRTIRNTAWGPLSSTSVCTSCERSISLRSLYSGVHIFLRTVLARRACFFLFRSTASSDKNALFPPLSTIFDVPFRCGLRFRALFAYTFADSMEIVEWKTKREYAIVLSWNNRCLKYRDYRKTRTL